MICRTCLWRVATAARPQASVTPIRTIATSLIRSSAKPAAVSTPKPDTPVSSCIEGTVMAGVNYLKGKQDPVALADEEYPAWLWTCLENNRVTDAGSGKESLDEYSKSKKERRTALRKKHNEEQRIIASGDLSALEPKIPLTKQTINLPSNDENTVGGVIHALDKREELRRAMRRDRKAKIKENNYLKSM